MRHDVIDPFKVEVDRIYCMACPASPVHYQYNPIKTVKTSVMGAINCLGLAKRVGAGFYRHPLRRFMAILKCIRSPKATVGMLTQSAFVPVMMKESCAETLFFDYHRENKVDTRVVRIFNTYGPRMAPDDGRVVSNFIVQALKGEDLTIYGDGSQTRSFCYVDDLVEAILRTMEQEESVGPVNIGNPVEFTIRELAEQVLAKVGSSSKLIEMPLPSDDPTQRKPDISLAKKVLEWEPKVQLSDGLDRTIPYFSEAISR